MPATAAVGRDVASADGTYLHARFNEEGVGAWAVRPDLDNRAGFFGGNFPDFVARWFRLVPA